MNTEVELKCPKCNCDTMYKMETVGYVCTRCGYCPNKHTYLKASYSPIEDHNPDNVTFVDRDTIIE